MLQTPCCVAFSLGKLSGLMASHVFNFGSALSFLALNDEHLFACHISVSLFFKINSFSLTGFLFMS